MTLTKALYGLELSHLLKAVPARAMHARSLIQYLNRHPSSTAEEIKQHCSIRNISDAARKINPLLLEHGFFIACSIPIAPSQYRNGNRSRRYRWAIHSVPIIAANEETYRQKKAQ